jgi:hypothetical protein
MKPKPEMIVHGRTTLVTFLKIGLTFSKPSQTAAINEKRIKKGQKKSDQTILMEAKEMATNHK